MTTLNNPLQQHFRHPSIFLQLPSKGKFWPDSAIDIPVSGEIPILSMTALDEIAVRTPDGLLNGESTVSIIQSCVPNIHDAWSIPVTDLDSILVAIQIASYGNDLEISTSCPSCNETSDFIVNLHEIADKIAMGNPDYDTPFVIGDVSVKLAPMTYRDLTDNNSIQFEERKIQQISFDDTISSDEKISLINESFKAISQLSIGAVAKSVISITIDNAVATNRDHIVEFLKNCDGMFYKKLRNHLANLKQLSEADPVNIVCPDCNHQYTLPLTLDMSNFFE